MNAECQESRTKELTRAIFWRIAPRCRIGTGCHAMDYSFNYVHFRECKTVGQVMSGASFFRVDMRKRWNGERPGRNKRSAKAVAYAAALDKPFGAARMRHRSKRWMCLIRRHPKRIRHCVEFVRCFLDSYRGASERTSTIHSTVSVASDAA